MSSRKRRYPEDTLKDGSRWQHVVKVTAAALAISALVASGSVYGLNRYLGPLDEPSQPSVSWQKALPD